MLYTLWILSISRFVYYNKNSVEDNLNESHKDIENQKNNFSIYNKVGIGDQNLSMLTLIRLRTQHLKEPRIHNSLLFFLLFLTNQTEEKKLQGLFKLILLLSLLQFHLVLSQSLIHFLLHPPNTSNLHLKTY